MLEIEVLETIFFLGTAAMVWDRSLTYAIFAIIFAVYQTYKLISANLRTKKVKKMLDSMKEDSGLNSIKIRKDATDEEIDEQLEESKNMLKQAIKEDREDNDGE